MICLITGTVFLVRVETEQVMVAKKEETQVFTAPYDPRFPNTNQTKNCYQNYLDFQRCSQKRGENYDACQYFKKVYKRLCPISWIEKWDEQVADGVFPGKI